MYSHVNDGGLVQNLSQSCNALLIASQLGVNQAFHIYYLFFHRSQKNKAKCIQCQRQDETSRIIKV